MSSTTTLKAQSEDEFYTAFPARPVRIEGQPTYEDLRVLRQLVYRNASKFHSTRGGAAHGHLGMVMPATSYATLSDTAWVDPVSPDAPDVEGMTGPQISEANRQYAEALREFKEFSNLNEALLRFISESIEPLFMRPYEDDDTGLMGVTTKKLLQDLIAGYGAITPTEVEANRAKLHTPYSASEPFQVLVDRFRTITSYAADGGVPIDDKALISAGLAALEQTGVLETAIDKWTDKTAETRDTWKKFVTHFQPLVLRYQKSNTGKLTAHNMSTTVPGAWMAHNIAPKLPAAWVAPAPNDENAMAQANQAMANATILEQLQALAEEVKALKKNNRSRNKPAGPRRDQGSYCWSHGYLVDRRHSSATCRLPKPGHDATATRLDNKGGNQEGKPVAA